MHQNVRLAQKLSKTRAIGRVAQVESRTAFPQCDFGYNTRFIPTRRVDTQHLRPKSRKKPGSNRTREHSSEIEDPQPRQRAPRRRCPLEVMDVIRCFHFQERIGSDALTLRVPRPVFERTQSRSASAVLDD